VIFTATAANGGTNPVFQWKVNELMVGANSSTFIYIPLNNDVVNCTITSNATCATGNPAISNSITMAVNPVLPVGVSIAASVNPVDKGLPVTFTATAVNEGSSPVYQWKVNGIDFGLNSNSYTYIPLDGDVVICNLTSNAVCVSGNPATSNAVTMIVIPVPVIRNLNNITVTGNQCFDATQTIAVAGDQTTFTVIAGGSATLIAGMNILFYPGVFVEPGGYMYGYIAENGPWCVNPPVGAVVTGKDEVRTDIDQQFFKIYPNPTTGAFMVELNTTGATEKYTVEVYDMNGGKILSEEMAVERKHQFSLSGKPAGIYLIRVISESNSGTTRIIMQK
ncbi:MAG: T9SS type A sorting domain-containing protein, partial [Bacteroidota bacterium]